ncbi:MAG: Asp-tRNA(Asn)/Glu-tRNA(Gln) amidotransferase subunit GatA [Myxococcaceae bacterium]|nr:MAG: Asp-tRNA(Asn)/Glu-tRNA(Gln) amidotransferase subunit GatA [Myxococcaceae bacterium]
MGPTDLSMLELGRKLGSGELSSVEAVRACLARVDRLDGRVKAFLRVDREGALAQAEAADRRRTKGKRAGPLDGVPVGLKDLFLTEGLPTTAGSRSLESFVAPYDGTAVKLLRAAGTPILGKLNMDEFAMGSSTENSAFFPTRNPWNLETSPGGSSGGSAAAVAARMVFGALGTDTGGSIRQPAALTGTVGLKPTYGRVSRFGVVAFASSLDQVGPMTRDVPDCAALLQTIAVYDPADSTSAPVKAPDYLAEIEGGVKGMKLGLPREYLELPGMDPEVRAAVEAATRALEKMGAQLVPVSLPHTKYALATYYLIAPAEASSNLARYDGVRYGLRVEGKNLLAMYGRTRDQGFGLEVKRRIMLGTYALSAGYYDAYYLKAQKVRTLIKQDFVDAFRTVDAVISPTSPTAAFRIGEKVSDPLAMYLNDVFTLPCNLAGLPGLSLPCGLTRGNLPIGLQILGKPWDEARVLRIARAFEREHDFHRRSPPLGAA